MELANSTAFTDKLAQKLKDQYSPDHLRTVARETGFIERTSKFTAAMFLEMLLFKVFDNGTASLNDHSVYVAMEHQVRIRKQSIDERFSDRSVEFVRTLLEQHLSTQVAKDITLENLCNFTSVKIKDSTRFQLPAQFKKEYPGNGGLASEAGMHIQFEFDLLSGKVSDLYVTDSLHQDTSDAKQTAEMVEKGSLILRDLGYFSSRSLKNIALNEAYYISRLDHKINIYTLKKDGTYKELGRKKIHAYLKRRGLLAHELEVYIGEDKVPVRLIAEMMPEEELNNRLAKAHKSARRRGTGLSDRYIAAASLNLFVTNVPQQWVGFKEIRTLYRLRWQIEIRFKTWKSFCRLHTAKSMKLHRFETYLYACLLFILISWEITAGLLSFVWQQRKKVVSIIKCYKTIIQSLMRLRKALFDGKEKLKQYLGFLHELSFKELLLEKRKGHLSQEEILLFVTEKK